MSKLKYSKNKIVLNIAILLIAIYGGYKYYINKIIKPYFHFVNKMKIIPDNLSLVNVGTSGAYYAFDYSGTKNPAMNMAGYTQPFEYDLKILKKYKEKINKGAVVLITLEYPIFLFPEIPEGRKEVLNQFNKILRPETNTIGELINYFLFKAFPFLIHKNYVSVFNLINLENENGKKNRFTRRERHNIIDQKIRAWWYAASIEEANLKKLTLSSRVEKNMIESRCNLQQLVDFCLSEDWKPVLVMLPYSTDMNKRLSEDLLNKICYNNLQPFVERGILFLDYSHDLRLSSGDLYMDMEYLNIFGRKLFTNIVIEDLKNHKFYIN